VLISVFLNDLLDSYYRRGVEGGATVLIFISAYYFWSRWVSNESIGWEISVKMGWESYSFQLDSLVYLCTHLTDRRCHTQTLLVAIFGTIFMSRSSRKIIS